MGGLGSGRHGRRSRTVRAELCYRLPLRDLLHSRGKRDLVAEGGATLREDATGFSQRIAIMTTAQPGGGKRAWWRCPRCLARCAVLYAPSIEAERRFVCRRCLGIRYRSQTVTRETRWRIAAQKLRARAGHGQNAPNDLSCKPLRMRWRTYYDLLERADFFDNAAVNLSIRKSPFARILGDKALSISIGELRLGARQARRRYAFAKAS